jgi:hypothetical protein
MAKTIPRPSPGVLLPDLDLQGSLSESDRTWFSACRAVGRVQVRRRDSGGARRRRQVRPSVAPGFRRPMGTPFISGGRWGDRSGGPCAQPSLPSPLHGCDAPRESIFPLSENRILNVCPVFSDRGITCPSSSPHRAASSRRCKAIEDRPDKRSGGLHQPPIGLTRSAPTLHGGQLIYIRHLPPRPH